MYTISVYLNNNYANNRLDKLIVKRNVAFDPVSMRTGYELRYNFAYIFRPSFIFPPSLPSDTPSPFFPCLVPLYLYVKHWHAFHSIS